MKHTETTFEGLGSLTLFARNWLPEGKTKAALAIVHGFGEHSGRYMNVVNKLVPAGFAVYGFDLRGHGKSPGQRGHILSWKEYLEDVKRFLQTIRQSEPDTPLFLMGHSMGGLIVLNYALMNSENLQGVIASAPLLSQPGISPILLAISRILSKIRPAFSIDTKLDVQTISRDPQVQQAYLDDPLVHSRASARLGTEITAATDWTRAHASEFSLPLLIIHGDADELVAPQGSAEFFEKVAFSDKTYLTFTDGRHETHNDLEKEKELQNISDWLEGHI